ncbi:MAG: hypothetical protein LUG99_11810 [Lachnospiraceae bacterium]|nr:hypothetical protein [Lachnospiraceae bacterium]
MKKNLKNLDRRSKGEQLFILMLFCVLCFALLFVSGCGGSSCESIQYGNESGSDYSARGISIPGIGGCLNSGKGCNSCLWPQSCKLLSYNSISDSSDENYTILACDTEYYTSCREQKSCYGGWISSGELGGEGSAGIFCGSAESANLAGCIEGCVGCSNTGSLIRLDLDDIEEFLGIG